MVVYFWTYKFFLLNHPILNRSQQQDSLPCQSNLQTFPFHSIRESWMTIFSVEYWALKVDWALCPSAPPFLWFLFLLWFWVYSPLCEQSIVKFTWIFGKYEILKIELRMSRVVGMDLHSRKWRDTKEIMRER